MSYGMTSGALSRGRSQRIRAITTLFATVIALTAIAAGASSASAAFTPTSVSVAPSTLQAGSHPTININASLDPVAGDATGDDLSSLSVDLPAGLLVNPQSVATPCATTSFNADNCPAATQVGTISVSFRVAGKINTATGSVYSITPDANSLINFGFVVRPSATSFQKLLFTSGKATGLTTVRQGLDADYGLSILIPNIPKTIKSPLGISTAMTISNIAIALNPKSGSTQTGGYFTFNPTRCTAANARATFTPYTGAASTLASPSFTPTGCDQVKLNPTFSISTNNTTAGAATGVSATVKMPTDDAPIQNSEISDVNVLLNAGTTINIGTLSALATCSDAQLAADACPAGAKMGTATVNVPFLPAPMTGEIYLTNLQGVQFAYIIRGARGTVAILRGSAQPSDGGIQASFQTLPQVPWSSATLNFTSQVLNNPANACPNATAWAYIDGYSGSQMVYGAFYPQTNCPPDTTLTTTVTGTTKNRTPQFAFTATPATGATFQCSVDSGAYAACATPFTTPSLADGLHTFAVSAVTNGVVDPTPATASFKVDATPPTITITSPTDGQVLTTNSATLNYTTERGAKDYCSIDNGQTALCTTGTVFNNLADGAHKITVISIDTPGNAAILQRSFTVTVPQTPVINFIAPAMNSTLPTEFAQLNFTVTSPSNTPITKTICSVFDFSYYDPETGDSAEYPDQSIAPFACKSGDSLKLRTSARYRIQIDTTDANGQSSSATTSFNTGIRSPSAPVVVEADQVDSLSITNRTPTFRMTGGDDRWPNTTFDCALVAAGATPVWSPCGTPGNAPPFVVTSPLADGKWSLLSRATSGAIVGEVASMPFTVGSWNSTYTATTSTQQAGAHPDLDVDITPTGAGQMRSVDMTLPKGLIGSLNSFPACPDDQVAKATCPANTKVGTVDVKYTIRGGLFLRRTPGDVYFTGPQAPGDAAGLVIRVYGPIAPYADVIIPLRIQLINNGQNMRVFSDTIPTDVGNINDPTLFIHYWLLDFKMHINGSQGSPFPLLTNPTSCAASQFSNITGGLEGPRTAAQTIPYQATGCASLPFAPTISQTFTSQVAGQQTGLTADVNLPSGNSSMKSLTVTEPVDVTPRLASFGQPDEQCNAAAAPLPSSTFDPSYCPSSAAVGTMSIDSPLLAAPLTGTVYLIAKSPLPWLGVALTGTGVNQGVNIRLVGVTSTPLDVPTCDPTDPDQTCDNDVRVGFASLPDLPYSHVRMVLDGPDRAGLHGTMLSSKILQIAQPTDSSCLASASAKTTFVPASGGANATAAQLFPFTGCAG